MNGPESKMSAVKSLVEIFKPASIEEDKNQTETQILDRIITAIETHNLIKPYHDEDPIERLVKIIKFKKLQEKSRFCESLLLLKLE